MIHKILPLLSLAIFFGIFSYVYGEKYWEFQQQKSQESLYHQTVQQYTDSFSLEDIDIPIHTLELYTTPSKELLQKLVTQIDEAEDRVYIEVYIFTEKDLRDALIRAHNRWLDVQVLLENNPYKAPYLNDNHFSDLQEAGVNVVWSDPLNYSLNHAKMLIIDTQAYISTGNFSYATFTKNRDFFLQITTPDIVTALVELFVADMSGTPWGSIHKNLVLSPEYSREKIYTLIHSATQSIDFYFPYIADDDFQEQLFDIAQSGKILRGIVSQAFYKENPEIIESFANAGIPLVALNDAKLHAKTIIVDGVSIYIGSVNFSTYSFDENREVGIIFKNPDIAQQLQEIFSSDFEL